MDAEALGDTAPWMQSPNEDHRRVLRRTADRHRAAAVLVLEIVETAPVMKTATKTSSPKPAKLENGVTVNVPEFVGTGERVQVNPTTGEYLERAKD